MDITIYSTTTCGFCHALTAWLDKQNITYKYKLTDEDTTAMSEFMDVNDGMLAVPLTVIKKKDGSETKILGFDQPKFKQVLEI